MEWNRPGSFDGFVVGQESCGLSATVLALARIPPKEAADGLDR